MRAPIAPPPEMADCERAEGGCWARYPGKGRAGITITDIRARAARITINSYIHTHIHTYIEMDLSRTGCLGTVLLNEFSLE